MTRGTAPPRTRRRLPHPSRFVAAPTGGLPQRRTRPMPRLAQPLPTPRLDSRGKWCRPTGCDVEWTDWLQANATINTGNQNFQFSWTARWVRWNGNLSNDHWETFTRAEGLDVDLSNDGDIEFANTDGVGWVRTMTYINPPNISLQTNVFWAAKLWNRSPYGTDFSRGARTSTAVCGDMNADPPNPACYFFDD
jgi:hypothetical protein